VACRSLLRLGYTVVGIDTAALPLGLHSRYGSRVLEPGGRLLLTLDNVAHPLILLRNGPLQGLVLRLGVVPYRMGATLGPSQLRRAVEAAGLEVTELSAVSHAPLVPAGGTGQPLALGRAGAATDPLAHRPLPDDPGHQAAALNHPGRSAEPTGPQP
jgi:hypothetical protein